MQISISKPQTQNSTNASGCIKAQQWVDLRKAGKASRKRFEILNISLSLQSSILCFVKLHPEALGTPCSHQGWHDDTPVMTLMESLQLNEWLCTWNEQSDRQTKPHQPLLLNQNPMGGSWERKENPARFACPASPAGFKCTTFWRFFFWQFCKP